MEGKIESESTTVPVNIEDGVWMVEVVRCGGVNESFQWQN